MLAEGVDWSGWHASPLYRATWARLERQHHGLLPSLMQTSGRKQAWKCNDILNIDHALLQRENAQATDTKTDETERMVQENICLEEITWDLTE